MTSSNGIGELAESKLHNQLKLHYMNPEDSVEYTVNGYVIDVYREDELVEIQTSSFSSIKKKYTTLLKDYNIRMVYPIAAKKWLIKHHRDGRVEKRKSPKEGRIHEVFRELVSIPHFIVNPKFSLDVVMIHEEEHRRDDGQGSWRRNGWSIIEHDLVKIIKIYNFDKPESFLGLLPETLPDEFTTADITKQASVPKYIAQKMAYTLRKIGVIDLIGKRSRFNLYTIKDKTRD